MLFVAFSYVRLEGLVEYELEVNENVSRRETSCGKSLYLANCCVDRGMN